MAAMFGMLLAACGGTEPLKPEPTAPAPTEATTTEAPTTTMAMEHEEDEAEHHEEEAEEATHEEEEADHMDDVEVIEVVLGDFTISHFEVVEGETYNFQVTNEGVLPHEFRFVTQAELDGHEHEGGHDGMEMNLLALEAGESGEIMVHIEGFVQVACLIEGHYEAGMANDLFHH